MNIPDAINGSLELSGGCMQMLNIARLRRDKKVRGVTWSVTAFFATWGLWNCFYYPHLDQWLSFTGGLAVTSTNLIWVAMAIYYQRQEESRWATLRQAARAYHDSLRTPAGQPLLSIEAICHSQGQWEP